MPHCCYLTINSTRNTLSHIERSSIPTYIECSMGVIPPLRSLFFYLLANRRLLQSVPKRMSSPTKRSLDAGVSDWSIERAKQGRIDWLGRSEPLELEGSSTHFTSSNLPYTRRPKSFKVVQTLIRESVGSGFNEGYSYCFPLMKERAGWWYSDCVVRRFGSVVCPFSHRIRS